MNAEAAAQPGFTVRYRGVMGSAPTAPSAWRRPRSPPSAGAGPQAPADGRSTPACAQACPHLEAITFGSINDEHSKVAALKQSGRNYEMLRAEHPTGPRTSRGSATERGARLMATSYLVSLRPLAPRRRGLPTPSSGREPLVRGPLRLPHHHRMVCSRSTGAGSQRPPKAFVFGMALAGSVFAMFGGYIGYLFWEGPGIWGSNNPVGWAWDIVNFRVLGGHRARRYPDLRHPLPVPPEVAHLHQPLRGGQRPSSR